MPFRILLGRHRARCLAVRFPMPPVRPARETFTSYGSRKMVHLWEISISPAPRSLFPWTALRVRWVPLYYFPTIFLRPFSMYVALLRSDYYDLFDCLERASEFRSRFRFPTHHPPYHPFQALPCSTRRTQTKCCRWRVSGCPFRSLRLPNVDTG